MMTANFIPDVEFNSFQKCQGIFKFCPFLFSVLLLNVLNKDRSQIFSGEIQVIDVGSLFIWCYFDLNFSFLFSKKWNNFIDL